MPRAARFVVPDVAHHITQRGNRQQPLFFSDDDRLEYISILSASLKLFGTRCLAWCLMGNHVHLMLVPKDLDGLRGPLSRTHTIYAQRINRMQQCSGHLFQGRYASYPMDDGLTDWHEIGKHVFDWEAILRDGLEASDGIERALRNGLPQGAQEWCKSITGANG
jgi:putative transposase